MPKLATPLTDIQVRNAKPKDKTYTLADGNGMYLEVMPTGKKRWRMAYRQPNGKNNRLTFGEYPLVSLADARDKCLAARKLLKGGIDPAKDREEKKRAANTLASNTFEVIAREWHKKKAESAWQPQTADQNIKAMERDLFPQIGRLPISEIETPLMLEVLQQVEKRGALEVTKRIAALASGVFRYAIVKGFRKYDPIPALKDHLKPRTKGHHAAITVAELPDLLKAIGKNEGRMYPPNRIVLRLMLLTFVRTSELIETPWSEIDLENEQWIIPWQRMKMGAKRINPRMVDHHPFLPRQGWELLRELHEYTGGSKHLFPNRRDHEKPLSNGMILQALKRMGYGGQMTGHGFRSLAKGVLKTLKYPVDRIERQLSHASGEAYGGAYDREEFLEERKEMMQHYADYLEQIERGNVLIGSFGKAAA
ncbi:tyrosine-type recombinase/integrase [Undibacterium sp. WLX3042]|uniref:tyrosine-type recombinase/integrase n=1 Tax=Undibacterium sp. WLX3042 TaxID=3412686 RepID=UPI003C2C1067